MGSVCVQGGQLCPCSGIRWEDFSVSLSFVVLGAQLLVSCKSQCLRQISRLGPRLRRIQAKIAQAFHIGNGRRWAFSTFGQLFGGFWRGKVVSMVIIYICNQMHCLESFNSAYNPQKPSHNGVHFWPAPTGRAERKRIPGAEKEQKWPDLESVTPLPAVVWESCERNPLARVPLNAGGLRRPMCECRVKMDCEL